MRLKTLILSSTSFGILALSASPAWAQATQPENPQQAQESPADPVTASPEGDDAVQNAAGEDQVAEGEEIVVTGLRRSLQSAQQIKRNSEQIVDAIVAEDIGKLPDITVSDTAARIPGVQVQRGGGEANRVLIRGLPDIVTTYNGREIFTAEARFVALQDFPAGGISALEVFKSTTANLVEGGLAGLINVRSRRPFDFSGLEVAGTARAQYAYQSDTVSPNGNLLVSNRWDTGIGEIGALINFSYTELHFLDSARFNGGFIATARPEQSSAGAFRFPDAVGIFYGEGIRRRPSVNGAIQWRANPDLQFYVEGLYQGFRNKGADRLFLVPLFGDARFTNVVLDGNRARSLTVSNAARIFRFQGAANGRTNTYQFAAGGVYDAGPLRISADVARTDSKFDLTVYSFDSVSNRSPTFNANFDVDRGPGGVEFNFVDFDTNDAANYIYAGFFDRYLIAAGDDYQARLDVEYETGLSFIPRLEAGLRYVDRDGEFEEGARFGPRGFGTPLSQTPVNLRINRSGFRGSSIQPTRTWVTPARRSIRQNVGALRALAGFQPGRPPVDERSVFDAEEISYAGYGQLRYAFDLGIPVDGNVGIRAVKTEFSITDFSGTAETEYTDYLPNASARFRFTDELQLRLSATQTRTRPAFNQFRPTVLNSPPACFLLPPAQRPPAESCFISGSGGNPDLQPIQADNYDASLEYYFSGTGLASVALFRRDINGFITNFNVRRDSPEFGPGRIQVNIPVNAGQGRLQGVEAQLQTFFDYEGLPDFARGFGVQGNVTYIDNEQELPEQFRGSAPAEPFGIPGVSKWTYNLVGMYERGGLSARLAYNYRTRFVNFFDVTPAGRFAGEFTRGISRLDFSSSYTLFENLTLTLDVSNILGEPFRNFRNFNAEGDSFPRDVRYEETLYSLGVRFRL